jgi:hypothetical protein
MIVCSTWHRYRVLGSAAEAEEEADVGPKWRGLKGRRLRISILQATPA